MIYETTINYKNKTKNELIELLEDSLNLIQKQQEESEKKDKIIKWIKDYVQQEINFSTEGIRDYIDDDKEKNKNIIAELKEDREHWKDILRIINDEKTYMEF